jgi:hypothetical protein
MQSISLKLPEDLMSRLNDEADLRQITRSQVIRESLEMSLSPFAKTNSPSCFDMASDLAGSIRGLPSDLADNPDYMQGFGE